MWCVVIVCNGFCEVIGVIDVCECVEFGVVW